MTDFHVLLVCLGFFFFTRGIVALCDRLFEHSEGTKR
jgi:hypothetical protein